MLKYYLNKILEEIFNRIKKFYFLKKYRKDTPDSTLKFYNKMKYFYKNEFVKRENFNKILKKTYTNETLEKDGFAIVNISDVSPKKEFMDSINKFKKKFYEINQYQKENKDYDSKKYLINYNFEFNNDVKAIADPFVDIVTKYLGTLPILDSFQIWFSPNDSEELIGSKLLHRDSEDFRQIKIFIPIEEVTLENGPLNVMDKKDSENLYKELFKNGLITRRNQKIEDKYILENTKLDLKKIILNIDQCALVDTCACYHYGSRKSSKPRKLLFLHFTTAFSANTPILRNYDSEIKFSSERDRLVYGMQKKISIHSKKSIYLTT